MTNYICSVNRNTVLAGVCAFFCSVFFVAVRNIYSKKKKESTKYTIPFRNNTGVMRPFQYAVHAVVNLALK